MSFKRHSFPALVAIMLAAICAVPTVASAKMEVAMQDDLTVVDGLANREVLFAQFKAMGGTHVRIMYDHDRGAKLKHTDLNATRKPLAVYDSAVKAIVAHGLTPQFTLFWRGNTSPKLWSSWAQTVAAHFGPLGVHRYSIGNEPDLYEIEDKKCSTKVKKTFAKKFKSEMKGGRAKVLTVGKTVPLIDACNRYQRGVTYRKIFNPAAKGVRKGDKSAEVLAGETSPNRALDWFLKAAKPNSLKSDGWAHHPFQFKSLTPSKPENNWGIGNLKLFKKLVKGPIYMTEFGYPRAGSGFDEQTFGRALTQAEVAKALTDAWKFAKKMGAKQMLQYQWFRKPPFRNEDWDTGILDLDNGASTPVYDALAAFTKTL